tara:strand:+ start:583 stop:1143 length:561 start_codon:yes stop_codon:yes gene_type:complete
MKINSLVFVILLALCTSCTNASKLHRKKVNKAKDRIAKLVQKYPELKSSNDTTYFIIDTITKEKIVIHKDSIFIKGDIIVDTVISLNVDSIFSAKFDDIKVELYEMGGGQVRANIIREDHYIHYTDTIKLTDTIYKEQIKTVQTDIISTEKSFWWSLWDQVSGWIWWVLIIVAILLILATVHRFIT